MSAQQIVDIEGHDFFDALLEQAGAAAREVGSADALLKDHIPGEERLLFRPVQADGTRRMAGCVDDVEAIFSNNQVSRGQEEVGLRDLVVRSGKLQDIVIVGQGGRG